MCCADTKDDLAQVEKVLGWRTAYTGCTEPVSEFSVSVGRARALGLRLMATCSDQLPVSRNIDTQGMHVVAYRVDDPPRNERGWRKVLEFARDLNADMIMANGGRADLGLLDRLANEYGLRIALSGVDGNALEGRGPALGIYSKGTAGARVMVFEAAAGPALAGALRDLYKLESKPLFLVSAQEDAGALAAAAIGIARDHQDYASRTRNVRRGGGVAEEERKLIEAALPLEAAAKPKRAHRLLITGLNVGRGGHPSIPHANLAFELMGRKLGLWEAVVSDDPAMFDAKNLRQFDAVFLNNTIGDIFGAAERREAFAAWVRDGGGVIANHAATVTAPEWPEFGEILGATGANHRMTDEKVTLKLDDPASPLTAMFPRSGFTFADEIFRVEAPYSREKVRVLLSIDIEKTDMNQGRCYGKCAREDNDYAVSWTKQYGKGRVFYTTFGHNPYVFWDAALLKHFLAAAQYVMGDL